MYPNYYPYPYGYEYGSSYDAPEFRQPFEQLVGQFYTLPTHLTLPNGEVLHRRTRVFIHRVRFSPAGQQMVTIVFPSDIGGNCIAGSAQVSADQLRGGQGVQHMEFPQHQNL